MRKLETMLFLCIFAVLTLIFQIYFVLGAILGIALCVLLWGERIGLKR